MKGPATLRILNDDAVKQGGGFGLHAHVNMKILSIILQGKMNHKQHAAICRSCRKGLVQIMSAGSEEYNVGFVVIETPIRMSI